MKRINTMPMGENEFEAYTKKIIDTLGDDVSGFFTVIRDTFEYFTASDTVVEKTEISLKEFGI